MSNTRTTAGNRRFLKVELRAGDGAVLVRYNNKFRIAAAVSAAIRVRHIDGVDRVYSLTCKELHAAAVQQTDEKVVTPVPVIQELTRDLGRRHPVFFEDVKEYTEAIESFTPEGSWGLMSFSRIGVKHQYETIERGLNPLTWNLPENSTSRGMGRSLPLADGSNSAVNIANSMPTAWHLMVFGGILVGGIDPTSIPACAPQEVHAAVQGMYDHERKRREAWQFGRGIRSKDSATIRQIAALLDDKSREAVATALVQLGQHKKKPVA